MADPKQGAGPPENHRATPELDTETSASGHVSYGNAFPNEIIYEIICEIMVLWITRRFRQFSANIQTYFQPSPCPAWIFIVSRKKILRTFSQSMSHGCLLDAPLPVVPLPSDTDTLDVGTIQPR